MQHPAPVAASAPPMGAVPPGSMITVVQMTGSKTCDNYKHTQSIRLGAVQIIIGILCIIFNSVVLGVSHYAYGELGFVGHGIWCGLLFIITGIFGVLAGKKKTRCQIITFMVLSIISAAFTIILLILGIIGALTSRYYDCSGSGYQYDQNPSYRSPCYLSRYAPIVAMDSLLAIFGVAEAIVAIWASTLGCRSGVCCCSSPMMVLPSAGYFPQTGQMIFIGQTDGGQYVYAPQPTPSLHQGTTPPPNYVQQSWAMPTTNIGPVFGQAPPAYGAGQAQPLWMVQPSTEHQDLSAYPSQHQTKEPIEG